MRISVFNNNIDASFAEIPRIPENFHAEKASRIFTVFTSFQNKRKKLKENARVIVNSECACRLRAIPPLDL